MRARGSFRFEWPTVAFVARRAQGEGVLSQKPGGSTHTHTQRGSWRVFCRPRAASHEKKKIFDIFHFFPASHLNLRAQIDGCVCIRFVASSRKKEAVVRDAVKQEANNKKKKAGDTSINPTGPDRWRVNYRHVVTTRFVAAATHTHTQ